VRAGEHARLRELRLAALGGDPDAFGATYARDAAKPEEFWRTWAAQSEEGRVQRTFVLTGDDDRWLGLALVRPDGDRPGAAVLNAMWVAPEARGRRAAARLCDACARWAAERGLRQLTLTVVAGNDAGRRAYEAAGFRVCGTTTWSDHGGAVDALVGGGDRDPGGRTLDEHVMVRAL
jgi:RimJ/RimL family protein N-acetyltransferase